MDIIPYKPTFVQVGITPESTETENNKKEKHKSGLPETVLQRTARTFYDYGLNVFPQPLGRKGGYPWKRLQYTRTSRTHDSYNLRTLFAGTCNLAIMCGKTSNNLFIIDCETPDALAHHMTKLRERNIPLWVVTTARGGHIYLQATNGEVQNIEPGVLTDAEIKGCNGYVLAPPSVHPTGAVYEWLVQESDQIPRVHSNDIDWLTNQQGASVSLVAEDEPSANHGKWSLNFASPMWNLSYRTRDYIHNGHTIAEGSRNNRLFAAACDLHGNDYSHSECVTLLASIATASGLPRHEVMRTIASAYSQPREPSRKTRKPIKDGTWRYALLYATEHNWHGRTSATNRALFLALIERARVSSNDNDVFRASVRELAELARLSSATIQRALDRLCKQDLIKKCGFDRMSGASLWAFSEKVIKHGKAYELKTDTVSVPPHWLSYSVSLFNSDAVERGALGHGVMFIYEFMSELESPAMPSDIARMMALSVHQVNYALRKLRSLDLVTRLETGWWVRERTLPQLETHVASYTDVMGKGDARRRRHMRERQVFASRLLFDARLRREKQSYQQAIRVSRGQECIYGSYREVLADPLMQDALSLGGVVRLPGGYELNSDYLQ